MESIKINRFSPDKSNVQITVPVESLSDGNVREFLKSCFSDGFNSETAPPTEKVSREISETRVLPGWYICPSPACVDRHFRGKRGLSVHISTVHRGESDLDELKNKSLFPVKCPRCPDRRFKDRRGLASHDRATHKDIDLPTKLIREYPENRIQEPRSRMVELMDFVKSRGTVSKKEFYDKCYSLGGNNAIYYLGRGISKGLVKMQNNEIIWRGD